MDRWLSEAMNGTKANLVIAIVALLVVVIAIVLVVKLVRRLTARTYIEDEIEHIPRLLVRDAAAIDKTRRLVLISRDNVEHLILIGGPTDLVIETNIIHDYSQFHDQHNNEQFHEGVSSTHITQPHGDFYSQTRDNAIINEVPELNVHYDSNIYNEQVDSTNGTQETAPLLDISTNMEQSLEHSLKLKEKHSVPHEKAIPTGNVKQHSPEPVTPEIPATAAPAPSPARLHPTYPLKQVSAAIYSGRSTRNQDGDAATETDRLSNLRIENPYRKTPQKPTSAEMQHLPNEQDHTNVDPKFEDELQAAIKKE